MPAGMTPLEHDGAPERSWRAAISGQRRRRQIWQAERSPAFKAVSRPETLTFEPLFPGILQARRPLIKVGGLLGPVHGQNRAASAPYGMEQTMSWLALWLLVVFSWGLKEIDEAQATTNAQFDTDDSCLRLNAGIMNLPRSYGHG